MEPFIRTSRHFVRYYFGIFSTCLKMVYVDLNLNLIHSRSLGSESYLDHTVS